MIKGILRIALDVATISRAPRHHVTRLLLPRRLRVLHFAAQCARVLHPRPGASLGALLVSAEGHAAHVANITGATLCAS